MATIDLRSDTVTRPTDQMRKEMANAPVGDDVYAEDPTVNKLQELAAETLGFEAGLFVPSGSMGNEVALWAHTESGQEVVLEAQSHIFNYELATMSSFIGVMPRPIETDDGVLPVEKVKEAIHPDKYYLPETGLITVENSHNNQGGRVYPVEKSTELLDYAESVNIPVHLDGARVFNAAVASEVPVKEITDGFDSVMFCLSKGLGAPIGSMLVGSKEFIDKALVGRKMFGGGMRQVGIIAAAGVHALNNHVERLAEDHENARKLAEALKSLGFSITPERTETNIFFAGTEKAGVDANQLAVSLQEKGIVIGPRDDKNIRFVTHLDVSEEDIDRTIDAIKDYLVG